ncbi:MAG: nucleoside-diphosphate kinase [Candidatus Gastranaerophilales bacterium]|nr:nucleoside-diphosphate kinase [Candidatus Gastranaerophilales bacterium]
MLTEERTFVAIKPDGVQRGLIGDIVTRFERKGFKILGMKLLMVSDKQAADHYAEHEGKPFYPRLVKYIQSGPIVAMVIKGYNVVESVRHIVGATSPLKADVGTIRADFAQVMEYNVIHASDCIESAEREISIYFDEEEIFDTWKTKTEELIEEDELL